MDVPSAPKAFVQGKAARFGGIEGNHVSANRQVFGHGSKARSDVEHSITQIRSTQIGHPTNVVLIRIVGYIEQVVIRTFAERPPMDIAGSKNQITLPGRQLMVTVVLIAGLSMVHAPRNSDGSKQVREFELHQLLAPHRLTRYVFILFQDQS